MWEHLMDKLKNISISDSKDQAKWVLEKKGAYTTCSMYRYLSNRGMINKRLNLLWSSRMPLKIKVFLWLAFQDRLPTGSVLKKRNWKGCGDCIICKVPETADHIFFLCPIAKFVWTCASEALHWNKIPTSMQNFLEGWLPLGCKDYRVKLLFFAAVLWSLWITRNKMTIEGVFIKSPSNVIFKLDSFIQRWRKMLCASDGEMVESWRTQVQGWLEEFLERLRDRPPEMDFI